MTKTYRRYYPESDGGTTYCVTYTLHQPRTYYVVDDVTCDRVMDCDSWGEAKREAERLNRKLLEGGK